MIEGSKINIRMLCEKEVDLYFYLCRDFFFKESCFFSPAYLSSKHSFLEKFKENALWGELEGVALIVDKEDEKNIIGSLWFQKAPAFDAFEISYAIFKKENRGNGFMGNALFLFTSYLFYTKKINRLQLYIPDYNRAALSVAKKCGYIFEGIARKAFFNKGKYIDVCLYSILREEKQSVVM